MSFFGSLSKKWKKVKHKVDSVASPSHIALNATLGKKKGQAVGDQIDVAIGSAYTFGLGKVAANAGESAEAKDKYKAAKKAAKKAKKSNLVAAKKGGQYATTGYVPVVTPFKSQVGQVALANTGGGSPVAPQLAAPSFLGGLESGLESFNRALDPFVPDAGAAGGGFDDFAFTGEQQDELASANGNANGTNPLTFVLVAGGLLVLVYALRR